ncbi:hypothetical protein [Alcanivorax quisquiliarum]|uniref:hypothetical protein n=1 Tax=Alcanivorax quisquiliarum TaxID=2933565 RepID=UPI0027D1F2E0|nr:hypothetical protein [Alcanivorax quisquiliarum]
MQDVVLIDASGYRVPIIALLPERPQRDARRGLATPCIGDGQSVALVVERP